MKANFKKLRVEVTFDDFKEVDVTKVLGNFIHANTPDIGLDDVARAIYHSEGEMDIPDEYTATIISMVQQKNCMILAGFKKAIINELTKE